jgi:hypothetical protein
MLRLTTVLFALGFVISAVASAQNQAPASDPSALALAAQSIAALTGGTAISDVTLTGNAILVAGSDGELGTVTLRAKGTGESRIDLSLSGGQRSEVRSIAGGFPQGTWTRADGVSHDIVLHNCWTDSSWFFPALSSLAASNPNVILSYVGQESRGGTSVQHLHSYVLLTNVRPDVGALTQQVSATDFYLDSTSLLPVAITFNTHADNDASTDIAVEIRFLGYQPVSGIQVPSRIQKFVQGAVTLDLTLNNASVNSGLPDSLFNVR